MSVREWSGHDGAFLGARGLRWLGRCHGRGRGDGGSTEYQENASRLGEVVRREVECGRSGTWIVWIDVRREMGRDGTGRGEGLARVVEGVRAERDAGFAEGYRSRKRMLLKFLMYC